MNTIVNVIFKVVVVAAMEVRMYSNKIKYICIVYTLYNNAFHIANIISYRRLQSTAAELWGWKL
jgi:hypothetical protein